jgi:hypothetical protein
MFNSTATLNVKDMTSSALVSKAQALPGVATCIVKANTPGYEISAMISNSEFYLKGGFLKVVTFYKVRKRRQSAFPRLSTTIVAEVLFNSDEEVVGTECFV